MFPTYCLNLDNAVGALMNLYAEGKGWKVASNFLHAITEVRSPLRRGRIWRGRETLAPEFLVRLFWSPNPLPSNVSLCSLNLSIATQEDDPPCRPSVRTRASEPMMKMCQQRALSCQILLLR